VRAGRLATDGEHKTLASSEIEVDANVSIACIARDALGNE
jgi:hypothetical protein